ncbi:hypothetical protein ACFST9_14355 [Hymenobacter monticola]|uniref:hypothetical protein n=1 Tax=Hymenobacter monticola TaxID=1705399 RepID=UPI003627BFE4
MGTKRLRGEARIADAQGQTLIHDKNALVVLNRDAANNFTWSAKMEQMDIGISAFGLKGVTYTLQFRNSYLRFTGTVSVPGFRGNRGHVTIHAEGQGVPAGVNPATV